MPKRKKLPSTPDYVGSGENPEKLLVQKSNPLQSLSQTSMTLPELKILDAYLSRINSHEPDKRYVRFEKGELEKLLGVTRMHREELSKRVKNLFQAIEVCDERKPNGFICIALFSKAECWQDDDGLWQINLACSEEAMEYIFNVENLGYLKYRLKNVINLTSRYSYILYLFLEDNSYRKKLEINLEDLKKMLNCTAETYNEYKRFNDLILKKCQKEINAKTTINFTYTPVKKGRKVTAISFEVESVPAIEEIVEKLESKVPEENKPDIKPAETPETVPSVEVPEQETEKSYDDIVYERYIKATKEYIDENNLFLAEAVDYEFDETQILMLREIISNATLPAGAFSGRKFAEYEYLMELYEKFRKYADCKKMSDVRRFLYFKKMVQNNLIEHPFIEI